MGALAAGLSAKSMEAREEAVGTAFPRSPAPDQIGRPVRVVSIGFSPGHSLEEIVGLVEKEGSKGADIIVLPETCRGQNEKSCEPLDGPTVTAVARLASRYHTYIVCPIDRQEGSRRFNSAVLLDRQGQVVNIYNKLYPVWQVECVTNPPVDPGEGVTVYTTDFGRVGFAILPIPKTCKGRTKSTARIARTISMISSGRRTRGTIPPSANPENGCGFNTCIARVAESGSDA
jgi:hypothetical protein